MAKTGATSILISARELARAVITEDEFIRRVETWLPEKPSDLSLSGTHTATVTVQSEGNSKSSISQPLQATSGGAVPFTGAARVCNHASCIPPGCSMTDIPSVTSGGGVALHDAMKNMTEIRPGVWQSEKPMGTVDAARLTEIARSITRTPASTGDTPQPQERKGADLLDWFIAGIRTYTSSDPMPFADETYELRKKIIGYIEAGQHAALGKTPDAREGQEK